MQKYNHLFSIQPYTMPLNTAIQNACGNIYIDSQCLFTGSKSLIFKKNMLL